MEGENQKTITEEFGFKPSGPFYNMVTSFMTAICAAPVIFEPGNPMNLKENGYIAADGVITEGMHFYPYSVRKLAQDSHITLANFTASCCIMLANTAYETVQEQNNKSPEFEFLRHIRNASSHSNKFNFNKKEPKLSAQWRGCKLDHTLRGGNNPLYGKTCFGEFIGPGDLVHLLYDIEQQLQTSNP